MIEHSNAIPNQRYQNNSDETKSKHSSMGLPLINPNRSQVPMGTPLNSRYRNVYEGCDVARSMLNTRLEKLKYERELMRSLRGSVNQYPIQRDVYDLYNYRNLHPSRGQLGNPNLYSYQYMDPIYYPLEMPVNGEPVALPRIELGGPVETETKQGGLGIGDLLTLLNALGKFNNHYQPKPKTPIKEEEKPEERKRTEKTPSKHSVTKAPIIPDSKPKQTISRGIKRDWWKLCKNFIYLYIFFSTARKYTKRARIRNNLIASRTKAIVQDIAIIKDWIIAVEEPFWNEFKVFEDLNVSFSNIDSTIKKQKETQKIIAMIKKYMENLIAKSSKLKDIPERIQSILYEYVKDKAFYPKKYLSTFQVNRMDFYFYGGTKGLHEAQVGMIIAYLIISGVTSQQILLHMRDIFIEFKNYPNIDISAKYIGSIMHYLTRDTFQNDPIMVKDVISLLNYYRNYHLFNEQVEKQQDIFNSNMTFIDEDEFAEFLVPETKISDFWTYNKAFAETYKNFIYAWACKLGRLIRKKFQPNDPNLVEEPRPERPKDKTVEYDIQIGNRA